jgi:hypothetical protein
MCLSFRRLPIVVLRFVMLGFARVLEADDLQHFAALFGIQRLFRSLRVRFFAF